MLVKAGQVYVHKPLRLHAHNRFVKVLRVYKGLQPKVTCCLVSKLGKSKTAGNIKVKEWRVWLTWNKTKNAWVMPHRYLLQEDFNQECQKK